ncbi:MAG: hypothetical protein K2I64_02510 [Muribaculaceae bacterium]|nr:hypothetical protein [Muribaculaceae bacterium]
MTARAITDFLHSRPGGRLLSLVGLLLIAGGYYLGANQTPEGVTPAIGGWGGAGCALAATVAVISLLRLINKQFNIMRSESSLGATVTVAMAAAIPWVATTIWAAWMLPGVLLIGSYLLFATYGELTPTRTVYLIFTLTTASAFIVPQALFYLPVILIGCVQMRIFSLRVAIAALLGIVTPAWIAVGFGLCPIDRLPLPSVEFSGDIFSRLLVEPEMLAGVAVIVLFGLIAMGGNLYKLLRYNAFTRATNGFLTLLFLATLLLLIMDINNLTVYIPLLIVLAGYQVTLFFVTRHTDRSWIGIAIVTAIFWGLYLWNLWITLPAAQTPAA